MKRLSCFAIAAITALWGGTAAGYAGIEHGWLAMMSGNVWQDFDPAFYDTLTRVFEPLTLTAHRQYMIRKFYAIGCMLPDMFTREGWKASRGIVRDLYPWRGVLPDPLSISGGTYEQVQDSIVWKDPEPNQNLPALEEMALYARAQNWSAYEKALVYGAYAHVAMDLQAGVIQLPSLWGSDFVADPPEAVGPPGIDILRTAESHDNFFEPTYIGTAGGPGWDSLILRLFGEANYLDPEVVQVVPGAFQFYSWHNAVGDYQGWQAMDFPPVARFVDAANAIGYDVTGLTAERVEAYLLGYAIVWFTMCGHRYGHLEEAGGVLGHPDWTFGDIAGYFAEMGGGWGLLRNWPEAHALAKLVLLLGAWGRGIWSPDVSELPNQWTFYLEQPQDFNDWWDAMPDSLKPLLQDFHDWTWAYLDEWTSTGEGDNPASRATYRDEPAVAACLLAEVRRNVEGGPAYLDQTLGYSFQGGTWVRGVARKAGLAGGMFNYGGSSYRQPGLVNLCLRTDTLLYASLDMPVNGDPYWASLFYDLLPFSDCVYLHVVGRTPSGTRVELATHHVTSPVMMRASGDVAVDLVDAAHRGVTEVAFAVTAGPENGPRDTMLDSDYQSAYDAHACFYANELYQKWFDSGYVRRQPGENPLTDPRMNWPYVLTLNPSAGWYILAPSGLVGSYGGSGARLQWQNNSQCASGIEVWRATNGGQFEFLESLPGQPTEYVDTAAAGGDTYAYYVRATREGYSSEQSNVATVIAQSGWFEMTSFPGGCGVFDGGWLAADGSGRIYATRGHKTPDFCRFTFDAGPGSWEQRAPVPYGEEWRAPYRGCRGVCDGGDCIYMTKGNNTQQFWRYSIAGNSWAPLAPVPLGVSGKRVKGGTDMVYVVENDTGYVYLLKGWKTDFFRFNTVSGVWDTTLPLAPAGVNPRWDNGSWLAYDGANAIYAHKAKYHELWPFDLLGDTWYRAPLRQMPLVGMMGKTKKSKDGGSAAYDDGAIYALKGGNTQEFWLYSIAADSWVELDTLPQVGSRSRKKRVKGGGDIVAVEGAFYALKGNKTLEFWRYVPALGGQFADMARRVVVPPGGQQTDGESPVMEGIEASAPRWRSQGTACAYCKDVNGTEQVFWRRYVPPGPEVQLSFGQGDCYDPCFDTSGNWVYFCREDSLGGCYTQVCRVAAAMVPPPVEQLTFGPYDAAHVEVSPTNAWCAYDRESDDGHTAIFRIPAVGGQEQQLTQSGPWDDETPVWLDSSNLGFVRWPDNGDYAQLLKLNLQTMEVTVLTGAETDHEEPCPSYGGNFLTFSALDPSGTAQVGRVSATGGDETFLTSDQTFDITEPDMSQDGVSIFAVRTVGPGSEIGLVDAQQGGYTALTDASAIRESPDCYYSTTLLTNFVIYSREALDGADGYYIRPKYRKGTGIFLCLRRRSQDGVQAGSFVFALEQMRPNPARGRVSIRWQVPTEGLASLKVYDASGRLVRTLHNGRTRPGAYRSVWNGRDDHNREVAAGIYFLTLEQNGDKLGRKVVLAE